MINKRIIEKYLREVRMMMMMMYSLREKRRYGQWRKKAFIVYGRC
jgi:hypothetical protein